MSHPRIGFALALLACSLPSPTLADVVTWPENGHGYEVVLVPTGVGWNNAQAEAHDRGGFLAGVANAQENAFLFNLVNDPIYWTLVPATPNRYFGPWLGGHQPVGTTNPNQGWEWDDGDPWSYTNWLPGLPDHFNNGPEYYTHFFGRENIGGRTPQWNDASDPPPTAAP